MSELAAAPDISSLVAVILAGGFGTRIRHLSPDLPKPMIPVSGKPFLEWIIRFLAQQEVRQVVVSTGYLGERIESYFETHPIQGVSITCVRELEPLGTAGGFLNSIAHIQTVPGAWLVMNGDSLAVSRLNGLVQALNDRATLGALLGVRVEEAARFGTLHLGKESELLGFHEKRPGAGVISAGIYVLRPEMVAMFPNHRPLSFESDVFPALTAAPGKLKVCVTDAPFLDIGTPESLPLAESFVRETGLLSINA